LIEDHQGTERHRIEGFLPTDDYLAQLKLGLGKLAFQTAHYDEAEKRFDAVYGAHPQSGSAAEAAYWAGVSRYKATNDGSHLARTADLLKRKFPDSEWTRKASVWEA
jgi:outer membrane protein assembly factor BamD (BamD/ComL family)